MNFDQSKALFEEANRYIPGGVNSPVRAFKSVGLSPLYIRKGAMSHLWDEDGNEYIDYISSWGPLIAGHTHEDILEAIRKTMADGTSFGACNYLEIEIAKRISELFPSIDKVRMVSSGTEATMSAIRLARGYTKREKIIKFQGCYHGHADSFLVEAGSGLATFGTSGSLGVTQGVVQDTLVASFNDIASVEKILDEYPDEVAAVIVEPIMGNMGLILPQEGFLKALRELTEARGVLLIFDEVISGFRASKGGAQALFGVYPDLTTLGKIIGGGLPVGAFGGSAEIMDCLSPVGGVYQAGTLSGNPLAIAAGLAMIDILTKEDFQAKLKAVGEYFHAGIKEAIAPYSDRLSYNCHGSLSTLFFKGGGVRCYADAMQADREMYAAYFRRMLEQGIYLPPSQFECIFLGSTHTEEDMNRTFEALRKTLKEIM